MKNIKYTKIDDWVREIIVDPLAKEQIKISEDGKFIHSTYGRIYPIVNNIYDFRLLNNTTTDDQKVWKDGQDEYELFTPKLIEEDNTNYDEEINENRKVYEQIPIIGSCLDVGGNNGTLRAFLDEKQKYVICDPYINVFNGIKSRPKLVESYPFLNDAVNFVSCDAEFLPFKSCSFDNVHMRSCIDHFLNPEQALNEAYRVLKDEGSLIIGLFVHGGKTGKETLIEHAKDIIRFVLPYMGVHKYTDHHIWHPTYDSLVNLITDNGFEVKKVYWQTDDICYIQSVKRIELKRKGN